MNQHPGTIGRKLGMTQFFDDNGIVQRVTVIEAAAVVVGKRTLDKDRYSALIVGLDERKPKHTNKPLGGFFKKAGVTPKRILKEFRLPADVVAQYEIGQKLDELAVEIFGYAGLQLPLERPLYGNAAPEPLGST